MCLQTFFSLLSRQKLCVYENVFVAAERLNNPTNIFRWAQSKSKPPINSICRGYWWNSTRKGTFLIKSLDLFMMVFNATADEMIQGVTVVCGELSALCVYTVVSLINYTPLHPISKEQEPCLPYRNSCFYLQLIWNYQIAKRSSVNTGHWKRHENRMPWESGPIIVINNYMWNLQIALSSKCHMFNWMVKNHLMYSTEQGCHWGDMCVGNSTKYRLENLVYSSLISRRLNEDISSHTSSTNLPVITFHLISSKPKAIYCMYMS